MAEAKKRTTRTRPAVGDAAPDGKAAPRARNGRAAGEAGDGRGKKLVVVESPAKAKTINRYLGSDFIVKASMGHVRDLPEKALGVDIEHRFAPTYEPLAGRRKVLAELKKSARTAPEVFLATDLDREGEAIAWHLAESLGAAPDRIRRVVFNEITKSAIQDAFAHPRNIDMNMVNAQQARRILDRIVGYQVSPLLWRKVTPGLSAGRVQSVAVRLIVEREAEIDAFMPTEYWKISAIFVPEPADAPRVAAEWIAFMAQRDELGNGPGRDRQSEFLAARSAFRAELVRWRGERFEVSGAEAAVEAAKAMGLSVEQVIETPDPSAKGPAQRRVAVVGRVDFGPAGAPPFVVSSLSARQSRSRPMAPLTTAAMQQAASVQLRFGAQRTMRIAQQLYEGIDVPGEGTVGLITYMRTDSTHLSREAVAAVRELIRQSFGDRYLPDAPNTYSSGERAQEAHEAIRPTDARRTPHSLIGALSDEQYKLYDLVWKRFVACQMSPAVWNVTEADIAARTAAGEANFKAMGRQLEFDGFMRVTGVPKSGDQLLPTLREGQNVGPVELSPTQHFTQPPPRYTEASLVKALEAEGIGRPSTYANIIQTIQDRQYVRLEDRSFRPTDLGKVVTAKLVEGFPTIFDVRFTAHMEDELDQVEEGATDWVKVLSEFYGPFSQRLQKAAAEMVHAKADSQPSDYTCEKCGRPMVYKFSRNGRYLACTGYPDCRTTAPVDEQGRKVERREVDTKCPNCGANMILRRSRFGPFLGCSKYPECKTILPCGEDGTPIKTVKPEEVTQPCPDCGAPMAVKFKGRRPFMACTRYPDCTTTAKVPDGIRVEAPPKPPPKDAGVKCPKCGRPMLIRDSRRGEFLACSGFPRCRNAMNLDKLDELKANQAAHPESIPTPPAPKAAKAPGAAKGRKKPSGESTGQ
jgi:DNA topoisomerase-1